MNLIDIYNLINRLETEIGNRAHVWLQNVFDGLAIRVDWYREDFHVSYTIRKSDFDDFSSGNNARDAHIDYIIAYCKNQYERRGQHATQ